MKSEPRSGCPVSIPVSESTHFRVLDHETSSEECLEISSLGLIMTRDAAEEAVVAVGMESQTEIETQRAGGAGMMCDVEEAMSRPPGKTDSPSKRKGTVSFFGEFGLSRRKTFLHLTTWSNVF